MIHTLQEGGGRYERPLSSSPVISASPMNENISSLWSIECKLLSLLHSSLSSPHMKKGSFCEWWFSLSLTFFGLQFHPVQGSCIKFCCTHMACLLSFPVSTESRVASFFFILWRAYHSHAGPKSSPTGRSKEAIWASGPCSIIKASVTSNKASVITCYLIPYFPPQLGMRVWLLLFLRR